MLAFSIMLHHDEENFRHLFSQIYRKKHVYVIHVDAWGDERLKTLAQTLALQANNVFVVPSIRCRWGGWSLVVAELAILKKLCETAGWTHCLNLSGQCFPIKPLSVIENTLAGSSASYMTSRPIPDTDTYRYTNWQIELPIQGSLGSFKIRYLRKRLQSFPKVYKGYQWKIMHRDFCNYLLSDKRALKLKRFFRTTAIPDEHYIPTVVQESPFLDRLEMRCMHYMKWDPTKPEIMAERHLPELLGGDHFFARKFVSGMSDRVRARLEKLFAERNEPIEWDLRLPQKDIFSARLRSPIDLQGPSCLQT